MKWWLYNRFRYMDSKYVTGTSMENRITIRAHQKANVFLTSYANIVGHVYFNAAVAEHRMERNREYEFEWPASGAEDPVIGINDADLMTSLGDLSPLMVELIDVSGAPHITDLKLGSAADGYVNYSMNSITLGNNVLLRTLDLRNCVNLTQSVDASGCTNIEEAYFDGTSVTGVSLPNGGILKVLHLPETVTNLTVLNQKAITDFTMAGYSNVTTLRVENSPAIPALTILNGMAANSRVRIIGFNIEAESGDEVKLFLDKLNSMRGLDENGNNVDKAQVSGSIHVGYVTPGQLSAINAAKETYPSLSITYDEVGAYLTHQLVDRTISGAYANDRVTSVGAYAFYRTSLATVVMPNVESLGTDAFYENKSLTSVDMPKLTMLGIDANNKNHFFNCSSLSYINMPMLVKVAIGMFKSSALEEVVFANVTDVEEMSFQDCKSLTRVDLPVASMIDWKAFANTALETLILRKESSVCQLTQTTAFESTPIANGTGYIYVPRALVDSYKAATNWSAYASNIRAIEDCPDICGGV